MQAIQQRWDCIAYWHHSDATFEPDPDDPEITRLVEWPDRRSGNKIKRSGSTSARFNAAGVRVMSGSLVSEATTNGGAFTVYVSTIGTDPVGSFGLIAGPNFSMTFADGELRGNVTTNSGSASYAPTSLSPSATGVFTHLNTVDLTDGNRIYVNGQAGSAWSSRGRYSVSTGVVTLNPGQERYYRSIAIFGRAHENDEIEEIVSAIDSASAVSEPPDCAIVPPWGHYSGFSYIVPPAPYDSLSLDFIVPTPDYCLHPEGGAT